MALFNILIQYTCPYEYSPKANAQVQESVRVMARGPVSITR